MASTLVSDLDSLFGVGSVGPGRGKKGMNSTHAPRKRKSAMKDFSTEEEYKKFAKSRNAATKRCRQKKEELKILREENPALREENARLRHKSEEALAENAALKGRLAEMERELEEALARLKLGGGSP